MFATFSKVLLYWSFTAFGIVLGVLKQKNRTASGVLRRLEPALSVIQTVTLVALIFVLGAGIGANEQVMDSISQIAVSSILIAVTGMAGSVGCVFAARKFLKLDHSGAPGNGVTEEEDAKAILLDEELLKEEEAEPKKDHTMSLIVVSIAAGMAAGYFLRPAFLLEHQGFLIDFLLCAMLVTLGIEMGEKGGEILRDVRIVGLRMMLIPVAMIGGTLVFGIVGGLLSGVSVLDSLTVSAGFGWYSLGPALIAPYSAQLSAVSFLCNMVRETVGIILIPVVAKRVGGIECTALPGISAMDLCLPVITRSAGTRVIVYSVVSGMCMSVLVPVLIPLFLSIG